MHLDVAIKHITELEFFNEFKILGFENHSNAAWQLSTGLDIEIKFKDHQIQRKRTLFSQEASDEPIINKPF